jgi:hypothetical protein
VRARDSFVLALEKVLRLLRSIRHSHGIWFALLLSLSPTKAHAQSATPETAPPLFPGGGLVSYNSVFTTRSLMPSTSEGIPVTAFPTFSHEGNFNFTWGFHPDLDLTILLPIVTSHYEAPGVPTQGETGIGDMMVLVKYRFYRHDSPRGTTQASVTAGPKLPSGITSLTANNGALLPAGLQPGSGSFDAFLAANWTYTGLFNIRRLVADEDFHSRLRTQGTQSTRLGSDVESRFWISYRPYEANDGSREWFIGPVLTWLYSQNESVSGVTEAGTGGNVLLAGITTYVGLRPGMHVWLGMDWDIAHSTGAQFMPVRNHISFGITQQFRMHF